MTGTGHVCGSVWFCEVSLPEEVLVLGVSRSVLAKRRYALTYLPVLSQEDLIGSFWV